MNPNYLFTKRTPLVGVDEACGILGLSKSTLYRLTSQGLIPHYKQPCGRKLYFDEEELKQWAMSCKVKTQDEIRREAMSYCQKNSMHRRGGVAV